MRTYERRRNMEFVPYGQRAKHPEHTAEYQLAPDVASMARLFNVDAALQQLRQDVQREIARHNVRPTGALQDAERHIGEALAALDVILSGKRR